MRWLNGKASRSCTARWMASSGTVPQLRCAGSMSQGADAAETGVGVGVAVGVGVPPPSRPAEQAARAD